MGRYVTALLGAAGSLPEGIALALRQRREVNAKAADRALMQEAIGAFDITEEDVQKDLDYRGGP